MKKMKRIKNIELMKNSKKAGRFTAATFMCALLLALLLCGCSDGKNVTDGTGQDDQAAQNYPVGSYERKAADKAASGEEDDDGEVIRFGSKSIFKGIEMECDENGEIVCTEEDGALWYKITDKRFGSYRKFKNFVKQKSGSKAVDELSQYFGERDGALYFVDGARNRTVKDKSQYYLDDSSRLTVSVNHTEDCRKKYGLYRSHINFVRKKGVWKLDSLALYNE